MPWYEIRVTMTCYYSVEGNDEREAEWNVQNELPGGAIIESMTTTLEKRELHVDGTSVAEDVFVSCERDTPGMVAPFVVFDADAQTNIAGPFDTWDAANARRQEILNE